MIYLTGDIHANFEDIRFDTLMNLNKEDIVIFLGDFGFDWNEEKISKYNVPCITLFLAGNHENFDILDNLPREEHFGAEVGVLKDRVYHLLTGNIYTIEKKKFLIFGGADSIDKMYRTAYVSWWPHEIPTMTEYLNAEKNLKENNYKIDYLLTHTCSPETSSKFFNYYERIKDPTEDMIKALEDIITSPYYHYFGHHHKFVSDGKHTCLYYEMMELKF